MWLYIRPNGFTSEYKEKSKGTEYIQIQWNREVGCKPILFPPHTKTLWEEGGKVCSSKGNNVIKCERYVFNVCASFLLDC